jgi:hypothetical protein
MKPLWLSLTALVCLSAASMAQQIRPMLRYDRANEVAVRGTVVEVRYMARAGSPHGTYLVLRTELNTLNVHLGPRAWAAKRGAQLSPGEPVEVLGVFARYGHAQVLLAREIHTAGTTLTFRNERGFPIVNRRQEP